MIWYITLWTNDIEKAAVFYDKILWEMWAKRFMETERFISWSFWEWLTRFSIIKPFDKNTATVGNGSMIALNVATSVDVIKMYKLAIELGATSEWEAGPRWDKWFYAWYIRDLDGNKLSFFNHW
jgi:predicted lactoylglutathione lyase